MGSFKRAALAGVAMCAIAPAFAADLPPMIQKAPIPVEDWGGWYLRGDVGWSSQRADNFFQNGFGASPLPASVAQITSEFTGAGIFGIGLGWQANNWLRLDVTGEYRTSSAFRGYDIVTAIDGTLIPEHPSVNKTEWVFLANAYADLGTWWCITPFVGAGIGFANVRLDGFNDFAIASLGPSGALLNANNSASDGSKTNFAWAVHAGLAYKVNPGFTIELAYRYLDMGDGVTGSPITGFDGTLQGTDFHLDNITSHDVKIGVRWMLEEPMAPPLMRKG